MERFKYLLLLLMLAAIHLLLGGLLLAGVCLLLGAALYPWFSKTSYFFLRVLALEVVLALAFWLLVWRSSNSLGWLIANSDFSAASLISAIAGVNIITVTLCTSLGFYVVRAWMRMRKTATTG